MKQQPSLLASQQGLTLVELLVALSISLILLGGVYQVLVSSTTVYRKNEQFARMQENARFAMEILGRELRTAGYTGCSGATPTNNLNPLGTGYISEFHDFTDSIRGFDWVGPAWSPALNTTEIQNAVDGSDVIIVRGFDIDDRIEITGNNTNAANLAVVSRASIAQGEIVIVSDCVASDIFQVTNNNAATTLAHGTSTNPGNTGPNLSRGYNSGAEVYKFQSQVFYVRNNAASVPSLYRIRWTEASGGVAEELVEGIENMQIRYGVDTSTPPDRQVDSYVSAAGVADWAEVMAVRVGLLVQGPIDGKAAVDTNTYDLDADGVAEYDPPDERRMRRVFKSTFVLRNRAN